MFATLLGALPRPTIDDRQDGEASLDELVVAAIRAQEGAGLEPISDGRLRGHMFEGVPELRAIVEGWRFAAGETDRAVKQVLPGPYSIGRRAIGGGKDPGARAQATARAAEAAARAPHVMARAADALRAIVGELAAAGCPLVEIEETEAHLIGEDPTQRELFREAHQRLTDGIGGTHLSLSIVAGSAWGAGFETVFEPSYSSLAVDLIEGPDNWNLVTRLPGDRGVIAGALPARDSPADAKELILWAARYAAASQARGLDRVGIGSAGSWANLTWEAAVAKLQYLGEAARLAATPAGEDLVRQLDPRAVDARTAALGHGHPRRCRRR